VMSLRKRSTAAVAGIAVLAVLSACDNATAGRPVAEEGSSQTSESPTDESTPEKDGDEYSLKALCGLASPEETQELGGAAEGKPGTSVKDGHPFCQWDDRTSLVVGVQEGQTTAGVETGPGITNTPTTVDGLTAVQQLKTDPVTTCQLLVDLPSGTLLSASVAVLSAGEGQYDACQVANQLANLITPRVKDQ
jgi:hypothetical protein